ncbi:MAG: L-histidine N-alpha-methyltransferase [Acidimicrobiales bacterium]|jgi:L-histidine N-alpha-methyltransferase
MTATRIDVHLEPGWWRTTLEHDVRTGLLADQRSIPAKWFYDELGSQLFDDITKLDEYYPFRAERDILATRASEIIAAAEADTLVELGSGTSEKSRVLLDAMAVADGLKRYVPFDVSEEMLRSAADQIAADYPGTVVHGIVGDFDRHIPLVPIGGTGMVALLGSTIGNFEPTARKRFIADVVAALEPGGTFLLGTDLVKDTDRLWAAYNDAQGVTAQFNLNMLTMINRELNADFDLDRFEHAADWDAKNEWIDIRLRSKVAQTVRVRDLDLVVDFAAGEEMKTEISAKFRLKGIAGELEAAGLAVVAHWTDDARDFAMTLARKR